jgi:peptidoglycan/xylan/chitin deacetylase (PgdA/CDA1 family)
LRCVALTFDDGPGKYTAQLLDELAAARAPATFFLVGRNVAKYPDLVAREVADGHAVGNHSWDHHSLVTLPPDAVAAELDQTTAAIQAAAGVGTTLVRPPYGATNDQVAAALAARGDAAIMWSVDTEDWKNRDVALTTQRALAGAAPGSIILMHDIHPTTVQAVPGIIDQLRAAGYTLVTVPQLLGAITPGQTYRHG